MEAKPSSPVLARFKAGKVSCEVRGENIEGSAAHLVVVEGNDERCFPVTVGDYDLRAGGQLAILEDGGTITSCGGFRPVF